MRKSLAAFTLILLATTACSGEKASENSTEQGDTGPSQPADAARQIASAEQAAEEAAAPAAPAEPAAITVPVTPPPPQQRTATTPPRPDQGVAPQPQMPDLSYSHRYGYEVPGDDIGHVQDAHLAACNALGAQRCKLGSFRQQLEGTSPSAELDLFVATTDIPALMDRFTAIAAQYDGGKISATIDSQNVTDSKTSAENALTTLLEEDRRLRAQLANSKLAWSQRQAINARLNEIAPAIRAARTQLTGVASEVAFTKVSISYRAAPAWWGGWLAGTLLLLLFLGIAYGWLRSRKSPVQVAPLPA